MYQTFLTDISDTHVLFSAPVCLCLILPQEEKVIDFDFKFLLIVYESFYGLGPSYLCDLLSKYEPSLTLRSPSAGLKVVSLVLIARQKVAPPAEPEPLRAHMTKCCAC